MGQSTINQRLRSKWQPRWSPRWVTPIDTLTRRAPGQSSAAKPHHPDTRRLTLFCCRAVRLQSLADDDRAAASILCVLCVLGLRTRVRSNRFRRLTIESTSVGVVNAIETATQKPKQRGANDWTRRAQSKPKQV